MLLGYWMHETSGVLRPAIENYLTGGDLTPAHVGALRAYLRQWMAGPWQGPEIDLLRASIDQLTTRRDFSRWFDLALREGIDPL
jgi:hypothetical protein